MNPVEILGRAGCIGVMAVGVGYFFVQGCRATTVSARLANFSLFCGLMMFVFPETVFANPIANGPFFVASGIARFVCATVGVILGVLAFRRRGDGGVGAGRPVVGILASAAHALTAVGLVAMALLYDLPAEGGSWVFESAKLGYKIRLPSGRWKHMTGKDGSDHFVEPITKMHAGVNDVIDDADEDDFRRATDDMKAHFAKAPRRGGPPSVREGVNEFGNPYQYGTVFDQADDGRQVFVAVVTCWRKDAKQLVRVTFEAIPRMVAGHNRQGETEFFEKSAERICLGIE